MPAMRMERHAFVVCVPHGQLWSGPYLRAWCGTQPACHPQLLPIVFPLAQVLRYSNGERYDPHWE